MKKTLVTLVTLVTHLKLTLQARGLRPWFKHGDRGVGSSTGAGALVQVRGLEAMDFRIETPSATVWTFSITMERFPLASRKLQRRGLVAT